MTYKVYGLFDPVDDPLVPQVLQRQPQWEGVEFVAGIEGRQTGSVRHSRVGCLV